MQNTPELEREKSHALKVLNSFLLNFQNATNPMEIESQMYAIYRASEDFFRRMHATNSDVRS